MSQDIDEEWKQFMNSKYNDAESSGEDEDENEAEIIGGNATYCNPPPSKVAINTKNTINTKGIKNINSQRLKKGEDVEFVYSDEENLENGENGENDLTDYSNVPKPTNIYISTKSKIAYLNQTIDLKKIFWDVPVIPYTTAQNGVIKKQIKFNSVDIAELNIMQEKLKQELYYEEQIITSINNPDGRVKFKDIRKLSIGISRKDIMSYRCKKKSAFYNCFVMILRIKIGPIFKEFHIKVFNTGKLEIPGIQTDEIYEAVLENILLTIQPHIEEQVSYQKTSDTVLINSNFNCGFYINRELLFDILKYNYNIECIYDPCSYPGIQCKYYYNKVLGVKMGVQKTSDKTNTDIVQVSFMIFRTGSVLIVGMCDEYVLMAIYEFLKDMLKKEFCNIGQPVNPDHVLNKDKKKKVRRKTISINYEGVNLF